MLSEQDLEPRVISMSFSGVFRIKQIGEVYLCEQRNDRVLDSGASEEAWKVVAKSAPEGGAIKRSDRPWAAKHRLEAFQWMHEAELQVQAMIMDDLQAQAAKHAQPR